jgi:hypothetical protein
MAKKETKSFPQIFNAIRRSLNLLKMAGSRPVVALVRLPLQKFENSPLFSGLVLTKHLFDWPKFLLK